MGSNLGIIDAKILGILSQIYILRYYIFVPYYGSYGIINLRPFNTLDSIPFYQKYSPYAHYFVFINAATQSHTEAKVTQNKPKVSL